MKYFLMFLKYEWRYHAGQRSTIFLAIGFFLLISILFPLAMGVEMATQKAIASGAIWIALLLSIFLSMPQIFRADIEQGVVEQWRLKPVALEWLICAKYLAVWAGVALPLLMAFPLAGLLLQWPWENAWILVASLLLGSLALAALGLIGAALMARNTQGLLLILLVLPLSLPVLIFGVLSSVNVQMFSNEMQILCGLWMFYLAVCPSICAAILRQQTS